MGLKLFDEVNMLAAKDTDAAKPLPGQWSDYVVTCRTLGIQINHLQSPKTPAQHPESQFSTANNTEVVTRTPVLPYVSPRVTQLSHCGFPWTRGSIRTAELSPSLVLEPSGLPLNQQHRCSVPKDDPRFGEDIPTRVWLPQGGGFTYVWQPEDGPNGGSEWHKESARFTWLPDNKSAF